MKRKRPVGFTMRVCLTLAVVIELGVILLMAGILNAILDYFDITLVVPWQLSLAIVCILLGGAVASLVGKWIFNPILKLEDAMHQVAAGNFHVRLEEKHRFREIQEIYVNFNRMVSELEATEILQTDFVSNVSHEFKTPISAIEGYATLLQGDEQHATGEQKQYVNKILFNTKRLSNLVGNILLLSKVDNQAIPSKQSCYRLDEQIRQSILSLEPEWSAKEIDFDVELDRVEYTGHETLLLHVWNNLIGNAIKFNPSGGSVRLNLEEREGDILFTVEDTGPGIRPEAQKHIFDRFYQSDSSHKEEGNGLGLALVKQILNLCGGTVTVENLPTCGCRFSVILKK